MNESDKKLMLRIYSSLQIPGPGGGSQSTTVKGLALYSKDAEHVISAVADVLRQTYQGEDWPGAIEDIIADLETWHSRRRSDDWQS